MKRKNSLFLFVCACVPGCGQMYQGYMKRGVSLLGAFCAMVALSSMVGIGELAFLLPVLWIYSFFDNYNLRAQSEDNILPDDYLFGLGRVDSEKLGTLCREKNKFLGWALIVFGGFALYQTVFGSILNELANYFGHWWIYNFMMYTLPRAAVAVFVLLLGIWFIRGPKPQEEFRSFQPLEESKEESDGAE